MATLTETANIQKLVSSMFNLALTSALQTNLQAAIDGGATLSELATTLAGKGAFDMGADAAAQSTTLLTNLGLATGTTAGDAASTYILARLAAGVNIEQVAVAVITYMNDDTKRHSAFDDTATLLTNKATVSQALVDSGIVATSLSDLDYLTSVDATAASVTTATTAITTAKATADAAAAAAEAAANAGTTFNLTTGIDTLTGTDKYDTFIADNTGTSEMTSTADSVNGGAGTDTIKIYSDGTISAAAALTSVETALIYDEDTNLDTSTTSWDSVTTFGLTRGDGSMALTLGANATTVNLTDMAIIAADMTVNAAAAATSLTLGLDKITVTDTASEDVVVTGAALTDLTVNTSGTASTFDVINAAAATTITINASAALTTTLATTGTAALTITGTSAVDLGALDADINTITATSNTGGVTAAIGANVDTVFTGSAGADVITAGTTDALVTANELAVDGGAGTDILVLAATADIDTAADAARYTNFETLRTGDSVNAGLISGITAIQLSANTAETISGLTATQAANITFTADNTTSTAFTLSDATGSTDSITFNLASSTATTDVDVIGASVIGIETVNVNATTGTNTTGDTAFGFLANTADSVSALNFTGTSDVTLNVVANTLDVVAVDIDASAMTGTADLTIATGVLVAGSSVTGTLNADTIAVSSTTGTTYDAGAGDDDFTGSVADLVATGTNDSSINGGAGTDTLTLDDTTTTLTDNHFSNVTNLETLALSNTVGALSVTTGSAFNTAFADGATITTGVLADQVISTINAGLSTVDMTITVDATDQTGDTGGDDMTITTGTGTDTITITGDATWVGAAGDAATITVDSGAGVDTISVTIGELLAQTTSQAMVINAGTGADVITKVGINGTGATAFASFVVDAGDSTTTAWDSITGFDLGDATDMADGIDFSGTAAIGTVATAVNFGTIMSSNTVAGVATFDDIESYTTALVINSTNLADVVGYLAANTAGNDTVAFTYDSDASGTADATMVYHNGTTDSLVMLASTTAVDALVTTAGTGANDLFIA